MEIGNTIERKVTALMGKREDGIAERMDDLINFTIHRDLWDKVWRAIWNVVYPSTDNERWT